MSEKELTVRDLKRAAAKRIFDLVIAKNASLPDKGSHTDAVVDMLDAIVEYTVQRVLARVADAVSVAEIETTNTRKLDDPFDAELFALRLFAALWAHVLPEKPPEDPGAPNA